MSNTDLLLVCDHLGDGGMQRVVSTLATAWSNQGRKISLVTLYEYVDFYKLDPSVCRVKLQNKIIETTKGGDCINRVGKLNQIIILIQKVEARLRFVRFAGLVYYYLRLILSLRQTIKRLDPPVIVSFIGRTKTSQTWEVYGVRHSRHYCKRLPYPGE